MIGKDRERVNLYIKEHSVSRIHARLLEENGSIYIEDLHSTNGTYLNDLPLTTSRQGKDKKRRYHFVWKCGICFPIKSKI